MRTDYSTMCLGDVLRLTDNQSRTWVIVVADVANYIAHYCFISRPPETQDSFGSWKYANFNQELRMEYLCMDTYV